MWVFFIFITAISINIHNNAESKNNKYQKITDNFYIFHNSENKIEDFYVQGDYLILENGNNVGVCKLSMNYNDAYRFEVTHSKLNPKFTKSQSMLDGESRFMIGLSFGGKEIIKDKAITISTGGFTVQLLKNELNGFESGVLLSVPENPQVLWFFYHHLLNSNYAAIRYSNITEKLNIPEAYDLGLEEIKICLSSMNDFLKYFYKQR